MKPEQQSTTGKFEKYKQDQELARQIAQDLGMNLDNQEAPEHFVIPIYNDNGEEVQKVFLSIQLLIQLEKKKIAKIVEAVKKYPNLTLKEAERKLEEENK